MLPDFDGSATSSPSLPPPIPSANTKSARRGSALPLAHHPDLQFAAETHLSESRNETVRCERSASESNNFRSVADLVEDLARTGHRDSQLAVSVPARELADLYQKLESQPIIEEAKGILMGHYGLDAERAFLVLRRWSQNTNLKLRLIAWILVDAVAGHPTHECPPHELIQRLNADTDRTDQQAS